MKERPIIFSPDMVRTILDGRKTQTRRVVKPQPVLTTTDSSIISKKLKSQHIKYSYGQVGDRLWVRETWASNGINIIGNKEDVIYKSDYGDIPPPKIDLGNGLEITQNWKPSIFMPKLASRITLEITRIRIERLMDITIRDLISEGCSFMSNTRLTMEYFKKLWNVINAKYGYEWEKNPWVWVIEFKQICK